jgi:hypothetical protein
MEQNADAVSASSQLKTTLRKLYPIEQWATSPKPHPLHPFAPRFCWEFFRADPEMLTRLGEAVRNYNGSICWVFRSSPANAFCLVATNRGSDRFVGYPPTSRPEVSTVTESTEQQSGPTEEFRDQALADVPNLCSHLERYLRIESSAAKSFDPRLIAPPDPPPFESTPFDFVERGMHAPWIVHNDSADSRAGKSGGLSEKRMLHFSVSADEWQRIHADILDNGPRADGVTQHETSLFPLSRESKRPRAPVFRQGK